MRSPIFSLALGAVSGGAMAIMLRYQSRLVFFITLFVWTLVLMLARWYVNRFLEVKFKRSLFVVTALALSGMISLIELPLLRRGLVFFGTALFAALFAALIAPSEGAIHIAQKPVRRFIMLIWVFDAYAIGTTAFALSVFFPNVPFWLIAFISAVILAYIAFEIWSLYYKFQTKSSVAMWFSILAFAMFELMFVVDLLPFGYLVAGLLTAWIWYLLQLFVRFHFGPTGVIWKKQWRFLLGNALLFSLTLLFLVRWV